MQSCTGCFYKVRKWTTTSIYIHTVGLVTDYAVLWVCSICRLISCFLYVCSLPMTWWYHDISTLYFVQIHWYFPSGLDQIQWLFLLHTQTWEKQPRTSSARVTVRKLTPSHKRCFCVTRWIALYSNSCVCFVCRFWDC